MTATFKVLIAASVPSQNKLLMWTEKAEEVIS